MLKVRKLAAIDLHFLGAKLILAEFGIGAIGSILLGVISVWQGKHRFHAMWMMLFGVYLIFVGINYVPLLLHAIDICHRGSAELEISGELENRKEAFREYRRQSLFLLVPLVVPIAAILQRSNDHTRTNWRAQ